ncbi:GT-D fold domain-containing glycosyltransferase [Limosilactobacillus reuteri]|uniref:GT-D fold domain-containing glycosyltransferase n=1 Tax=Limosilactobacillus reuteri TaxID=1598 RepID=UPI00226DAF8F|nr:GT-D fold domain-containing glycosyltransferase [Limosilactobacillus reuteri]
MGRSVVMATEPLYGVTVKDVDQTLDYILAHHSSVARFGDGEIDLIAGRDISYQSYDPALAEHLKRVLYTPSRPSLLGAKPPGQCGHLPTDGGQRGLVR